MARRNRMRKNIITLLMTAFMMPAMAQNPVIRDQFTADPTARVFEGKVWLYPSHDILPPEGQRQDWFCMADYHVFSSANLTDWTDHGMIVSQETVPWGNPTGYSMWAPDCVYKNGKYYFFFPNAPKGGRGFAIGVATSDRPEGPFTCQPEPIKGVSGIDPCVLIDDDGSAYLYWSGMGIRGGKLKDNMTELAGPLTEVRMPRRPDANGNAGPEMPPMMVGGEEMKGLPEGFKEGPFAFKRGGWYYLTFPWVRSKEGTPGNGTETLAYAMSKSPLGPWDFKGIIMAEHDNGCWTNHHSILEYKGQWYIFYHRNYLSPRDDKRRSACIEKIAFNADGTIQEVKETLRGVGINQATERIEIDRYSEASNGVTTALVDTTRTLSSLAATLPTKGSWIRYADVDFSAIHDGYVIVNAMAHENTEFYLREKSATGKVIAKLQMTVKSEQGPFRRDMSGRWLTLTAPLEYTPSGVTDVVVTCEQEGMSIDWVQFKNRPKYFSPVSGASSTPDDIVFTDSWLRDAFGKTYFKDQLTVLPSNGQKVKVDKQTLAWHALDSENYNVKLFRFAEKWGDQTYGSLFWGVTVIDSPEEMSDVRLAAGSNGASIWWLNGQEVLLLSGDRRMVVDDGMSARLTLKKGRNILRCAVINGPGLSDFCVRFLDKQGKPVKNLKITN